MTIVAVVNDEEGRIFRSPDVTPVVADGAPEKIFAAIRPDTKGIISIGVSGGLAPQLRSGDVVVGYCVWSGTEWLEADSQWTRELRRLLPCSIAGPIVGVDWVLSDPKVEPQYVGTEASMEARVNLWHRKTHAYAMNFDSHVAARVAHEHALPFAVLQVVVAVPKGRIPPVFANLFRRDGSFNVSSIVRSLIVAPWQVGLLFRCLRELKTANAAALRCRDVLGPGLGCPYLD